MTEEEIKRQIESLTVNIEKLRNMADERLNEAETKKEQQIETLMNRTKEELRTSAAYGGFRINTSLSPSEIFRQQRDLLQIPKVRQIHDLYQNNLNKINNTYEQEKKTINDSLNRLVIPLEQRIKTLTHA